jgi:hypothetical protein
MVATEISFLTPYWSGADMMRLHVASIRAFHPRAPILISKRGDPVGPQAEMEQLRREFDVRYWIEDCGYTDAYLRLLQRCPTRFVCISDHDVVLLSSIEALAARIRTGEADLVGVEERIRVPDRFAEGAWPGGWLRYAPGRTASNFLIFDWQSFSARWGLRGIFGTPTADAHHFDFDYGISQRLARHHYLQPFHAARYGLGNLLKDGDASVAWHQWYGSFRNRLRHGYGQAPEHVLYAIAAAGEEAFMRDYPNLDLAGVTPAWGPGREAPAATPPSGLLQRMRRRASFEWHALAARFSS